MRIAVTVLLLVSTLAAAGALATAVYPPVVEIRSPHDGATVQGVVTVAGTARPFNSGGDPVVRVEVRIDSGPWHNATGTGNWTYRWDTAGAAWGNHTVTARAWDRSFSSVGVSVRVNLARPPNRAPAVAFTFPAENAQVDGLVTLRGTVTDPDGDRIVLQVRYTGTAEGTWQLAQGRPQWSYAWDTTKVPPGTYRLEARAHDGSLVSNVATRVVTVLTGTGQDVNHPPRVVIAAPAPDAVVTELVRINGTASDPEGDTVTVEVRIVDTTDWTVARGRTVWFHDWATGGLPSGAYTIEARANDGVLYSPVVSRRVNLQASTYSGVPVPIVTEPGEGARVSGLVQVRGIVHDADNDAVAVQVKAPGFDWRAAAGSTAWSFTWDAAEAPVGVGVIEVRAFDSTGQVGTATRQVTVVAAPPNQPPTVVVTEPGPGASATVGLVRFQGTASDSDGTVRRVEVEIAGEFAWTSADSSGDSWWFFWDARGVEPGTYTLRARAWDGRDHGPEVQRQLDLVLPASEFGDTPANRLPRIVLDRPARDSAVNGTIAVEGLATDPDPGDSARRVELRIDRGPWLQARLQGNAFLYALDTLRLTDGAHNLTIHAWDGKDWSENLTVPFTVANGEAILGKAEANESPPATLLLPAALLVVAARRRR